jgi:bifunctional UDP-N-acetylglucosamine pyrophosphorylase / glucosamine-1-phosphate N-acetyltransferase
VILAAGEGTRMRSATPKVLHPVCGRAMIEWPVAAAREAGAGRVVVVDGPKRALAGRLPEGVEIAVQEEPKGTGDAVKAAAGHIGEETVVVLMGDVPLISAEAVRDLAAHHEQAGAAATMATMVLEHPGSYGRVVRDAQGDVEKVVEAKGGEGDATAEQLAIKEVNTGIYAFDGAALRQALDELTPDNSQGELYLPDVLPRMRARGLTVAAHLVDDPALTLGVNDRVDLANITRLAQGRILERHMRAGVTIVDPASTTVDAGVEIGRDTTIQPGTQLRGATTVGEGCEIGPHTTLLDCTLGDRVSAIHSYATGARADDGATIGPFAYLRPDAHLHQKAKVGTFVEVKNSSIGPGAKVPHLSYVGDAEVGEGSNLGAGTITANYDGRNKHRTTIGKNVRISVDTALVAPVTIGDGAFTGAGSVITEDVPPGALGIARERQINVEGYADRRK